ncbi:hypothetical protein N7468_005960 [Penicillium chermesinum]|uniref:Uncharacterized protein n=1 Tax=Penicillium chermesinum TaxID=63820 RepID=A0A9W9TQ69_9EURO|nr:uncharacterized protein N7468_005960 [Penicillium chermesinum]KAJ5233004.1 hypothetical protein N7468_005960 [Penicillium chermesinum]KAJ6172649.1 hypothetical protein N7470_001716 [Penicillium chermesinum]
MAQTVDKIIRRSLADADLDQAKHLFGVKFWGAITPGKGAAIGGALNGGVLSLTQGLASELAAKKIRVNTVVPGLVQTELWDKLGKAKVEQKAMFDSASTALPVGFVATPEDIAEAYLYAVRADYATGTLVVIGSYQNALGLCAWSYYHFK